MKILKHGCREKRKFTCGVCGCEFVAEPPEYVAKTTNGIVLWYFATCPDCFNDTDISEPWEEEDV